MLKRTTAVFALMAFALVAGCASDSDSSKEKIPPISGTLSRVLKGSTACLDLNRDYICEANEPKALVDATGAFKLQPLETPPANARVIVLTDAVANVTDGSLSSPKLMSSVSGTPTYVSLATTIMELKGLTQTQLKAELSIHDGENLMAMPTAGSESDIFERAFPHLFFTFCEKHGSLSAAAPYEAAATELMSHKIRLGGTVDHVLGAAAPGPAPVPTVTVGDDVYTDVPMLKSGYLFGDAINEVNFATIDNPGCLDAIPAVKDYQDVSHFSYYFKVINTKQDVIDSMDINAALSLNLETMSGSAQGEYLDDVETHTNDVFALITMKAKTVKFEINGMQLAGITDAVSTYFPACSTSSAHVGDMRYMYLCDYTNFAKICGNRFVKAVNAGGTYYGLMHIQATDQSKRRDIMVDLQGKYDNGVIDGSVKGDFKSHIDNMASKYSATFRVRTAGPAFDLSSLTAEGKANSDPDPYLINSSDKFFKYADIFMQQVQDKNGDCYGENAYKKCAVSVDFSDYQDVAHSVRDAATQERKTIAFKLLSDYGSLENYANRLDDILAHEAAYAWSYSAYVPTFDANGNAVRPSIKKTVTIDPDNDFWDTYYFVQDYMQILQDEYGSCLSGGTECAPVALPFSIPQMQFRLPAIKAFIPRSCNDFIGSSGGMGDYIKVDDSTAAHIIVPSLCEQADANNALTYLDIANNRSVSPDSPTVNYSVWDAADGARITTIFDYLRLNPSIGRVQLLNGQDLHTQTKVVGGVIDSTTNKRDPTEPAAAELLRAVDCLADGNPAKIDVDLTGTPLKFASDLTFKGSVEPRYEISATKKSWADADADAKARGGHLVEINTPGEFSQIARLFSNTDFTGIWVGLKSDALDVTFKSQYEWQTDSRFYNVADIGMDIWAAGFPQTKCVPPPPPPPKPLPPPVPPKPPKPEPPYVFPPHPVKPFPKNIWKDHLVYRESLDTTGCDETRRCALAEKDYSWGVTNVSCDQLNYYLIEYADTVAQPSVTISTDRKSLQVTVNDTLADGECVTAEPEGPVWLVPDTNP